MDQAYISTIAALGGTIIGGLTSFLTAWVIQHVQTRNQRIATETARRQEIYGQFMDELAQIYARALRAQELDYGELVKLFALSGRIKLIASPPVIAGAERAMKYVVDLYLGPPRTPQQMREMMDQRSADAIGEFATLCREEFRLLGLA